MPFIETITIMEALKARLASLPLDESGGEERLFEVVEYYGAHDLVEALQELIVTKQRVALIVPQGWDHDNQRDGVSMRSVRKTNFDVFFADRAFVKKTGAGLVGGEKNVGIIAMADRVVANLSAAPFALPELVFEPEDGAPIVLTKDEKKAAPGREAWAQSFSCYAGEVRSAVPQ